MPYAPFTLLATKDKKRLGVLKTQHGEIYTPAFGPDATRGLIKHLAPHEIKNLGGFTGEHEPATNQQRREKDEIQLLLSNTYHLRSYPGDEFIKEMGGLHKFMNWDRPILTDSGGFQVFSLIHGSKSLKGKVTDEGATFQDPRSGKKLQLTPENAIDIQFNLGSDIMIVLDDCRHYQDLKELKHSVYRTIEWAQRSKNRFIEILESRNQSWESEDRPLLFAVVQGGIDYELRKICTKKLVEIGFDGFGFGGWAINEKEYFPYDVMQFVADMLPIDKPRYAMGVGTPEDMLRCIEYGYDLFDCVIPSRNARHGVCYTSEGTLRITNAQYKNDRSVLDENIVSQSSGYQKYYLHHLFKIKDALGGELLSIHNLKYFNYIMRKPFI